MSLNNQKFIGKLREVNNLEILESKSEVKKLSKDFYNYSPILNEKLKGCIVGRNPDNKQKLNDGHFVLQNVLDTIRTNNLDIEVYLNASQEKKKNLMLESKVYVCPSSLDNGPRSMIEAAQAGCVLLAGQHIGSSGIIREGVNGKEDEEDWLSYADSVDAIDLSGNTSKDMCTVIENAGLTFRSTLQLPLK